MRTNLNLIQLKMLGKNLLRIFPVSFLIFGAPVAKCFDVIADASGSPVARIEVDPNKPSEIVEPISKDSDRIVLTISQWAEKIDVENIVGKDWRYVINQLKFQSADISPDGKYLAFSIIGHGKSLGGFLDLKDGEVKTLGLNGRIFWSPNSTQFIAELADDGTGLNSVRLYDISSARWKDLFVPDPKAERFPVMTFPHSYYQFVVKSLPLVSGPRPVVF